MHLLIAGEVASPPVLFLHGNTCSSTVWEPLMKALSDKYYCIAPDLRGFGQTEDQIIDATKGIEDWVEDLASLVNALELSHYHLVGHSLGGFVCWGMIDRMANFIDTVTLISPGPPMGFGGIHEATGIANNKDYSGSGGGIVVDEFVERLRAGDRSTEDPLFSPRNTMNRLFWKEGFRAEREDEILSAMLQIHTGEMKYPGDYRKSDYWPGVAPGKYGPVNALSPKYNTNLLQQFVEASPKPPLLWIHGKDDKIISDQSYSDPGYQGKLKLRKGWPGSDSYPPQPMIAQIKYALQQYLGQGGKVDKKFIDDCGHTPFIEKQGEVLDTMVGYFESKNNDLRN